MDTATGLKPIDQRPKATSKQRKRFYLLFEEANKVAGQDLENWFNTGRKNGVPLIAIDTQIARFTDRFTDMQDSVLSQPGVQITFKSRSPRELELLASIHGIGELDFTRNWQPKDRPDGHLALGMVNRSFSRNRSRGTRRGTQQTTSNGTSNGSGESASNGSSAFSSRGLHTQKGRSTNKGNTITRNHNQFQSVADGFSEDYSESESDGETLSLVTQFLQKYREEWYQNGLLTSVQDQLWMVQQLLRRLACGECMITCDGKPTDIVQVDDVVEPFDERPLLKDFTLKKAISQMWERHKFFFQPRDVQCVVNTTYKKPPGTNGSSGSSRIR